jgi:hypothetical protein
MLPVMKITNKATNQHQTMNTTTEHKSVLRHTAPVCLIKQQGADWINDELLMTTEKISRKGGDCKILQRWQHKLILSQLELE